MIEEEDFVAERLVDNASGVRVLVSSLAIWTLLAFVMELNSSRFDWTLARRNVLVSASRLYLCVETEPEDRLRTFGLTQYRSDSSDPLLAPIAGAIPVEQDRFARRWADHCDLHVDRGEEAGQRLERAALHVHRQGLTSFDAFELASEMRKLDLSTTADFEIPLLGRSVDSNWFGPIFVIGVTFFATMLRSRARLDTALGGRLRQIRSEPIPAVELVRVKASRRDVSVALGTAVLVGGYGAVLNVLAAHSVAGVYGPLAYAVPAAHVLSWVVCIHIARGVFAEISEDLVAR